MGAKDAGSLKLVASSHLILTTPEKWDAISRRWKDHIYLLGNVALLMVDEVHMLGDNERGATLESVICRMKTVRREAEEKALKVIRAQISEGKGLDRKALKPLAASGMR